MTKDWLVSMAWIGTPRNASFFSKDAKTEIMQAFSSQFHSKSCLSQAIVGPGFTDTRFIRTVFFTPEKSPYIFSKFSPLNTDSPLMQTKDTSLVAYPIKWFSYKVNLAYEDALFLTVSCNTPFLFKRKKKKQRSVDNCLSMLPALGHIG